MIIFRQIDNVWNHSRVFCCCSVVAVMLMPQHCPAPASAEVCGDDGKMEVQEMETNQQQHLNLVIHCDQQEEV